MIILFILLAIASITPVYSNVNVIRANVISEDISVQCMQTAERWTEERNDVIPNPLYGNHGYKIKITGALSFPQSSQQTGITFIPSRVISKFLESPTRDALRTITRVLIGCKNDARMELTKTEDALMIDLCYDAGLLWKEGTSADDVSMMIVLFQNGLHDIDVIISNEQFNMYPHLKGLAPALALQHNYHLQLAVMHVQEVSIANNQFVGGDTRNLVNEKSYIIRMLLPGDYRNPKYYPTATLAGIEERQRVNVELSVVEKGSVTTFRITCNDPNERIQFLMNDRLRGRFSLGLCKSSGILLPDTLQIDTDNNGMVHLATTLPNGHHILLTSGFSLDEGFPSLDQLMSDPFSLDDSPLPDVPENTEFSWYDPCGLQSSAYPQSAW